MLLRQGPRTPARRAAGADLVWPARFSRRPRALTGAALCLLLAAGCSTVTDRVILLPGSHGRPTGGVTVQPATPPGQPEALLTTALTEAQVRTDGSVRVAPVTEQDVRSRYPELLAERPRPAQRWVAYFETGSDQLLPQSQALLEEVRKALLADPGGEVVLVGHTDTVGRAADNDRLALQRAQTLREHLVAAGFPADRITVAGRGERELLVPTGDEVAEPRNRRVDIRLR